MEPMMEIILREQYSRGMPNKCNVRFSNTEADTALLGAALLSVGLFISSITENQLVAAIVSYAAMFLMLMSDTIANLFPVQAVSDFFYYLSYQTRYDEFVSGVVSVDNVMFFVSTSAIFIFLTTRVMEKRRWS